MKTNDDLDARLFALEKQLGSINSALIHLMQTFCSAEHNAEHRQFLLQVERMRRA